MDPHDKSRTDTWAKTKGLAEYAETHGALFGRMEMIVVEKQGTAKQTVKRLDVNDPTKMAKARALKGPNELEGLYE